ncbi:MAG: dihydrolipoyl dehydrogenase [Alphaproteobacteria bacterium]|nr:dihydrolipoyl dehydrogenase [Alphaproteobacteria bacterium]MBO6628239.1 dihydrolipoyl dehydrogenase [Alphaproteobacteria bacterium]MDF1625072.1 dihydrolipoyl dehydrogenase [Parvibaculaceae bacterium]
MSTQTYDVVVIGSGPGGYVAAIRAAQLGLKAAVVERAELGGICLNWGCIPTKALLRSAEIYHNIQRAEEFGLAAENVTFNPEKIVERSRTVAKQLSSGIKMLLKKNKVETLIGEGRLVGQGKVSVTNGSDTKEISAKNIILATGARARTLPGLEPDGEIVWSYREAMVPKTMPKSLLVIGSGAIGIEFASFYNTFGAEVTVVELMDRVLPVEDAEISTFAAKAFKKQGMTLLTGAKVTGLKKTKSGAEATIELPGGKTDIVRVEKVISAVGITGNIEDIGLESLGIKTDRGHVVVNEWCETGVEGIYAIGDLVGPPWLAHKASHEGVLVAERIAGIKGVHPMNTDNIPGCTYCHPQVASVGMTEAKAKEAGYEIKVGRFPFIGNGKAIALGEPEGLIKTIFDAKTGELLGAHMVGAEVTELIQGYTLARQLETTEADLMATVFPHPTLSEMMHESVLDAYGRALHI